ncbi:ATP-binding cassette domain-containing protein [Candidatus Bathyarchaeota archaeon]|nr:ATP-binding cassette domain-containing protein [Candidatus Bathyarchaeota archaeon]
MTDAPYKTDDRCMLRQGYYRSFGWWVFGHFMRHKALFIGGYILLVISTLLQVQVPLYLRQFFDVALGEGKEAIIGTAVVILFLLAVNLGIGIAGTGLNTWLTERMVSNVQNEFFNAIHQKSMKFYDSARTGELLSLATSDSRNLSWMASSIRMLSMAVITTISLAIAMQAMDSRLLLVFLLFVPFIAWSIYAYSGKLARVSVQRQEVFAQWQATLQENLVGIRVLRTLSNRHREFEKYKQDLGAVRKVLIARGTISARYYSSLLIYGAMGASFVVGSIFVYQGTMTVGTLVGFNSLILLVLNVNEFIRVSIFLGSMGFAGGRRVYEVLMEQQSLDDGIFPMQGRLAGHVRFDHVTFRYDQDGRDVIKQVDLTIEPDQTVAIVGHTGAGKTTLIKLLQRLYDPVGGRVLVDAHDIRTYPIEMYRKQVGIIEQDTFIFSATIKENILYGIDDGVGMGDLPGVRDRGGVRDIGKAGAGGSLVGPSSLAYPDLHETVIAAAKAARIHEFITTLPDGYDTMVGERGITLSGGQKQRIAIARALVINPPILVMDDSTSAVDARTEARIQAALKNLMTERTTIIITHRLSTIRNADLVVLMDGGEVRDVGTHEELHARQPDYASIFSQFEDLPVIPDLASGASKKHVGDVPGGGGGHDVSGGGDGNGNDVNNNMNNGNNGVDN